MISQVVLGNKIDVEDSKRVVSSFRQRLKSKIVNAAADIIKKSYDLLPVKRSNSILRDQRKGSYQCRAGV